MKVVTFGEIMGRLTPDGCLRLGQALPGSLNVTFAGAEANVAASLSMLGMDAGFITALPKNVLADSCLKSLNALGIDTSNVIRSSEGRLGLYFLETGANQRPSQVVYDRDGSSISRTAAENYPWDAIFATADWLHTSGITPAISRSAADATLAAVQSAKQTGCTVSCDLNFRKKLWMWDHQISGSQLAEKTLREILPFVDVVIANEEDCATVLSIKASDTDVESGELAIGRYPEVAQELLNQFANVSSVAITLRESISASHNNWGGMLFNRETGAHFAPMHNDKYSPYPIKNIVDRVGAGDSFAAGLIYALNTPELADHATAIRFAVAASCLAHSVIGDFNYSTRAEVESLMRGAAAGRVVR